MRRRCLFRIRICVASSVFAAVVALSDGVLATDSRQGDLDSVIALHGWPCGGVESHARSGEREYTVRCREGQTYRVMLTDEWNWHDNQRETQLNVLIAVSRHSTELQSSDASSRREAADRLGDLGPSARSAVPQLIAALRDSASSVRTSAARALGMIGPDAEEARPALERLSQDEDASVRAAAADALGRLNGA